MPSSVHLCATTPVYDINNINNVITIVVIVMSACQKFCYFSNVHNIVVQIHILDLGRKGCCTHCLHIC